MTINGNIKFFGPNKIDENCTFTFTTANTNLSSSLYDRNRSTKLLSIGSTDLVNEDWVIDFLAPKTFNRIYVDNHNISAGNIQYWDGTTYQSFSTLVVWTANTEVTSYFEFNSVTATKIRLRIHSAIIANAQKYVGELAVFLEIGTIGANPVGFNPEFIDKSIANQSATGGNIFILFGTKYHATLNFTDADATDTALLYTLKTLGTSFYIWPCGGVGQTDHGFRLQDIFFVNFINFFAPRLVGSVYGIASMISMEVAEV